MVSTNEHIALFDILVFFEPHRRYKIPMGTSLNTRGGKIHNFRPKLPFISKTVQDWPIVTTNH